MSQVHDWATKLVDKKYIAGVTVQSSNSIPTPPGYTHEKRVQEKSAIHANSSPDISSLQLQKAWQIAMQPVKSIPMNVFVSYMSGTSLQIISIMTALMLLSGPFKAILTVFKTFRPVMTGTETDRQFTGPILTYILLQLVLMCIGIQKLNAMGLVPNTKSDWLAWEKLVDYTQSGKLKAFSV